MVVSDRQRDRWRRNWDRGAARYDPPMRALDRLLFRDARTWVCRRATGDVVEVAIGTGLNLPHYPAAIRLVGIDHSAPMLAIAEQRLAELVSVPAAGEHFRRRPLHEVEAAGLEVTHRERFALGIVERISATKPVARSEVRR